MAGRLSHAEKIIRSIEQVIHLTDAQRALMRIAVDQALVPIRCDRDRWCSRAHYYRDKLAEALGEPPSRDWPPYPPRGDDQC